MTFFISIIISIFLVFVMHCFFALITNRNLKEFYSFYADDIFLGLFLLAISVLTFCVWLSTICAINNTFLHYDY